MNFIDSLRETLASRQPRVRPEWEARPAAVLVPLYQQGGEWHLLFTRRTDTVDEHKGQVSFPGGSVDAGDGAPEDTALRESEEEIGLRRSDVTVIGRLEDPITGAQGRITPGIGG